jgi:hypothetical protein
LNLSGTSDKFIFAEPVAESFLRETMENHTQMLFRNKPTIIDKLTSTGDTLSLPVHFNEFAIYPNSAEYTPLSYSKNRHSIAIFHCYKQCCSSIERICMLQKRSILIQVKNCWQCFKILSGRMMSSWKN